MPTYAYACTACDHRFEVQQSFTDDALSECPSCGGRLRKVFSAVGVVFKGSGFYRNDSRAPASSGAGKGSGKDGVKDSAKDAGSGAGKDGAATSSSKDGGSSSGSSSNGSSGASKDAKPSTAGSAA